MYLLEINPRISQAHTDIFEKIHGISHHHIMLSLALGKRPKALDYDGDFRIAAHFMLRTFQTGKVRETPSDSEIKQLKEKYDDLAIKINVKPEMDLDDMFAQDSYSYELANIFLGGKNKEELLEKYDEVVRGITFKIDYKQEDMLH